MDLDLRSKPWRKGEERRRKARILKTLILIFCSVRERERERERERSRRSGERRRSYEVFCAMLSTLVSDTKAKPIRVCFVGEGQ